MQSTTGPARGSPKADLGGSSPGSGFEVSTQGTSLTAPDPRPSLSIAWANWSSPARGSERGKGARPTTLTRARDRGWAGRPHSRITENPHEQPTDCSPTANEPASRRSSSPTSTSRSRSHGRSTSRSSPATPTRNPQTAKFLLAKVIDMLRSGLSARLEEFRRPRTHPALPATTSGPTSPTTPPTGPPKPSPADSKPYAANALGFSNPGLRRIRIATALRCTAPS